LPEGPMFEISRSTFHFSYHQSRGVFRRFWSPQHRKAACRRLTRSVG
jgi:hypothetical protein